MRSVRGFTLVELLVAVSIVVILAGIGFVVYSSTGPKSRDQRRKNDLQAIAQALEIYYQQNRKYPDDKGLGSWYLSKDPTPWIRELTTSSSPAMDSVPTDPKADQGNPTTRTPNYLGYAYRTADSLECNGGGNQYFVLVALLENTADPNRLGAKDVLWCGKSLYTFYTWNSQDYVLTNP